MLRRRPTASRLGGAETATSVVEQAPARRDLHGTGSATHSTQPVSSSVESLSVHSVAEEAAGAKSSSDSASLSSSDGGSSTVSPSPAVSAAAVSQDPSSQPAVAVDKGQLQPAEVVAHKEKESSGGTAFDCNICFDTPNDPVVTACGHLYCWACLYRWMRLHAEAPLCPVCKASVDRQKVTPIYGRGRSSPSPIPNDSSGLHTASTGIPAATDGGPQVMSGMAEGAALAQEVLPPRPPGHRDTAPPPLGGPQPFGFHPAVIGRISAYGNYGSLNLNAFGLFPNLFGGFQIAYPHVNEPARDAHILTAEQETQDQVSKVFLFLTIFVILVITWF